MFRLGLMYGAYRVLLAIAIFTYFVFNAVDLSQEYANVSLYFGVVTVYLCLCVVQFLAYAIYKNHDSQLILFGVVDVFSFAVMNYSIGSSGLYIGLLFTVTVFVMSMVQRTHITIIFTLMSIISVLYTPLFKVFIGVEHEANTYFAAMLSIIMIVLSLVGSISYQRVKRLEQINNINIAKISEIKEASNNIIQQIDTGYLLLNESLDVVLINPAAKRFFKITGTNDELSLAEINLELSRKILAKTKSGLTEFETTIKTAKVNIFVSCQLLKADYGAGLYLIKIDDMRVTAEKVQHLKLAALGQLSASIAHEIRNPLSSIQQCSQLLEGATVEQTNRYALIIKKHCDRINHIVESTLNMARVGEFEPTPLILLNSFNELLAIDYADRADSIELNIPAGISVWFDTYHFKQVFINLIGNALKHHDFNLSPKIIIKAEIVGVEVFIDVINYGLGVSEGDQVNLFEPFFTTRIDGTGLGLFLTKNLCESNRAKIQYINIQEGSCFRVVAKQVLITSSDKNI